MIYLFLNVFEFIMLISNSVKPKFDQYLNKLLTWKLKTKHGSFLVTPKWSFCEVFENFMLQFQNHFSPTLDLIVWVMQYHMISIPFSFWMYIEHVFQLESLLYDIIRLYAQDFPFFDICLNIWSSFQMSIKLRPSDFL